MFGLQLPLTCNPWTTLSNPCNNVKGKILLKKSSCAFLLASLSLRLFNYCVVVMLHEHVYENITNAVVWMVFTRPPTSKSSSPFNYPLVTVPNAPVIIGIMVTFMFYSFFNSLARSRYLSFFSHSFSFILWSAETATSTILQFLFFLLIILRSGLLAEIRWYVCISKSHRSLCVLYTMTVAGYYCCDYYYYFYYYFIHCKFFTLLTNGYAEIIHCIWMHSNLLV